ncbi:hypothetical protein ACTFIV_009898 [Dictyostelium citrinum]
MSTTRAIPVSLKDRSDIDFSTSLGGTLYGTTPGGTKIVYDRNALLQYRNSPLSKTPPPQLAHITNTELNKKVENSTKTPTTTTPPTTTAKPKPTNDDEAEDATNEKAKNVENKRNHIETNFPTLAVDENLEMNSTQRLDGVMKVLSTDNGSRLVITLVLKSITI